MPARWSLRAPFSEQAGIGSNKAERAVETKGGAASRALPPAADSSTSGHAHARLFVVCLSTGRDDLFGFNSEW